MSRRLSAPLRAVALFQAVLLLLVQLVDGSGAHRCPAHDGPGMAPVHAAAAMGHQHQHQPEHAHNGPCMCLGSCAGATMAVLAPVPAALRVATTAFAAPARSLHSVHLPNPADLLPFANGPPDLS